MIAGIIDVADYLDVYGLVNVWNDFNNLAFSTNPTIPVPSQGLGSAVRWMFTPNYYVTASIADANGNPHQPDEAFDSFFHNAEYFTHVELGHIGSWDNRFADNTHITFWQVDERKQAGIAEGWGVAASWSQPMASGWLPFVRAGFADGGAGQVDRSLSLGVGKSVNERGDYFGVGANWGRPARANAEGAKPDQYQFEVYYRYQIFPRLHIVPSVQYAVNPANDQSQDSLWLAALRLRTFF